jgi:chromosome partitioning protein
LEAGNDLYRLLFPGLNHSLAEVITTSGRRNLDVIRADKSTVPLKLSLAGVDFREHVLSNAMAETDNYDAVLIDCPPSVDLFQTAALVAADYLLIPTQLDQLAVKGVRDVMQSLTTVQRISPRCSLAGIIPTFYDRVTSETHSQLVHLARIFKQKVFPPIPQDTKCREATRHGQTLWEYAPTSRALKGFKNNGKTLGGYAQVTQRIEELI